MLMTDFLMSLRFFINFFRRECFDDNECCSISTACSENQGEGDGV
jgi:hypothetical protein